MPEPRDQPRLLISRPCAAPAGPAHRGPTPAPSSSSRGSNGRARLGRAETQVEHRGNRVGPRTPRGHEAGAAERDGAGLVLQLAHDAFASFGPYPLARRDHRLVLRGDGAAEHRPGRGPTGSPAPRRATPCTPVSSVNQSRSLGLGEAHQADKVLRHPSASRCGRIADLAHRRRAPPAFWLRGQRRPDSPHRPRRSP